MTRTQSWLTPSRILTLAGAVLLLMVLFVPKGADERGAAYSSYSATPTGVRALYETLARLGFRVEQRITPMASGLDSARTYVLIEPSQPLTSTERTQLLAAVRGGATLIFTVSSNETLADSLGFELEPVRDRFHTLAEVQAVGGQADSVGLTRSLTVPILATLKNRRGAEQLLWIPPDYSPAAQDTTRPTRPLVLAHRTGRGWAVAVASGLMLTNRLVANPRPVIAIVRALELTGGSAPTTRPIMFDEYHHGFGTHANMIVAIQGALTETPAGRMTLQVIVAGLVLLLVFAIRPLAPRPIPAITRRSPLEHVSALAAAYSQVNARQLAADRLLRGLRRRHSLGAARSVPNDEYLAALRRRLPTMSADVDRVTAALRPDSHEPAASVGTAAANIERAFSSD